VRATVVATSPGTSPGSYLTDGKPWTRWETAWTYPASAWFLLDLGRAEQMTRVRWHLTDGRYAPAVKIEVSADGNQWETLATGLVAGPVASVWQEQAICRSGRYLRWTVSNDPTRPQGRLGSVSEIIVSASWHGHTARGAPLEHGALSGRADALGT
jgi:hypothetical protein